METLSSFTQSWWFAVALGFFAGGTAFMWIDYLVRNRTRAVDPIDSLTAEEAADICADIDRTRHIISFTPDGASFEGLNEASSLSVKLMKKGIISPLFIPALKKKMVVGKFGKDFNDFLGSIQPYIRARDLVAARWFANAAISVIYNHEVGATNQDGLCSPQSPQDTEQRTQP